MNTSLIFINDVVAQWFNITLLIMLGRLLPLVDSINFFIAVF